MDYSNWGHVKSIVYETHDDSAEDLIVTASGETKTLQECLRIFEFSCSEYVRPASKAGVVNSNNIFDKSCTSFLLLLFLCFVNSEY